MRRKRTGYRCMESTQPMLLIYLQISRLSHIEEQNICSQIWAGTLYLDVDVMLSDKGRSNEVREQEKRWNGGSTESVATRERGASQKPPYGLGAYGTDPAQRRHGTEDSTERLISGLSHCTAPEPSPLARHTLSQKRSIVRAGKELRLAW